MWKLNKVNYVRVTQQKARHGLEWRLRLSLHSALTEAQSSVPNTHVGHTSALDFLFSYKSCAVCPLEFGGSACWHTACFSIRLAVAGHAERILTPVC